LYTTPSESVVEREPSIIASIFSSFRHRNYRLFWAGQLISLIGTWVQSVAHGWLVYELTRSPAKLGYVSAAGSVPVLLFTLFGGVAADRVNRRLFLIGTQSTLMLSAFILGILTITGVVRYEHILLLALLSGTANAFDMPTRHAFLTDIVEKDDLVNAVALNSAMFNTARLVGPALSGLVMSAFGPGLCFLINGASFLAVIASLAFIRTENRKANRQSESPFKEMIDGFTYLRNNSKLTTLISAVAVPTLFGGPYMMLLPVFAREVLHGGPALLGLLMSATGAGALAGAVMVSALSSRNCAGRLLVFGGLAFSGFLMLFSLCRNHILAVALLACVGWCMVTFNATTRSLIQLNTSDELQGRVMSLYFLVNLGLTPLGSLQAGTVASHLGAPFAVGAGGAICGLFALFVLAPRISQLMR
jgi:MFS family permease